MYLFSSYRYGIWSAIGVGGECVVQKAIGDISRHGMAGCPKTNTSRDRGGLGTRTCSEVKLQPPIWYGLLGSPGEQKATAPYKNGADQA